MNDFSGSWARWKISWTPWTKRSTSRSLLTRTWRRRFANIFGGRVLLYSPNILDTRGLSIQCSIVNHSTRLRAYPLIFSRRQTLIRTLLSNWLTKSGHLHTLGNNSPPSPNSEMLMRSSTISFKTKKSTHRRRRKRAATTTSTAVRAMRSRARKTRSWTTMTLSTSQMKQRVRLLHIKSLYKIDASIPFSLQAYSQQDK